MRTTDIRMAPRGDIYTHAMYMPSRTKAEDMTASQLRRGLCGKAAGNWHTCETCAGGCTIGRRLAAIMQGVVEEPTAKTPQPQPKPPVVAKPKTLQTPSTRKRLEQIHAQSIERAAAAILLHEQGTRRSEAAHAVGLAQWSNVRKMAQKYPAEVEKAKRRLNDENA